MNQSRDPIPSDDLDRLLRTWAAGREASAERLSGLEQRILAQLADKSTLDVLPESQSSRPRKPGWGQSPRSRPAWFLVAAASLLLIVTARGWLGGDRAQKPPEGGTAGLVAKNTTGRPVGEDLAPAGNLSVPGSDETVAPAAGGAALPKEQLAAKARLFAEMQAVFGSQLEWLAETTDHVELGLGKNANAASRAAAGDHAPLMVQVVVERRAAGSADWKTVWTTDVVALDQESVTWRAAEGAAPAALSLWAYRLPDGMVFVESDLTLSGTKSAIQSTTSSILEDNRATEVGSVDADGAEYRIFQTAAALDVDLG